MRGKTLLKPRIKSVCPRFCHLVDAISSRVLPHIYLITFAIPLTGEYILISYVSIISAKKLSIMRRVLILALLRPLNILSIV